MPGRGSLAGTSTSSNRSAAEPSARTRPRDPRPLRILHAIRSDGFSGVEQFVLRLALAQAAAGHRVTVIGGATDRMRPALAAAGIDARPRSTHDRGRCARCGASAAGSTS